MKNEYQNRLYCAEILGENKIVAIKRKLAPTFPLHWHDFFEIEFVVSGSGLQRLNGKEYEVKKGTAYLLNTTDFHEYLNAENITVYNIMFSESILSENIIYKLSGVDSNFICNLSDDNLKKITYFSELLLLETEFDEEYIKNVMECMIGILLKNIKNTDKKKDIEKTALIEKASLYMRMNFRENLTLKNISEHVNYNKSYFCKIFHEEMGITPKKYLSDLRLNYAKKLLKTTPLSVTEVCFACGYTSLPNFLKAFKSKYGITPKESKEKK